MAKRNTKADRILNDSAMRLEAALMRERLAQSQLNTAKAVAEAAQQAHDALVRELTPTPREKAEKPSASPPTQKEPTPDKKAKCGVCGNPEEYSDHDRTYINSHDFEPPKSVARAERKSKTRSASTEGGESSTPNTSIETAPAIAAGAGD
jgi:hypothetical protein